MKASMIRVFVVAFSLAAVGFLAIAPSRAATTNTNTNTNTAATTPSTGGCCGGSSTGG